MATQIPTIPQAPQQIPVQTNGQNAPQYAPQIPVAPQQPQQQNSAPQAQGNEAPAAPAKRGRKPKDPNAQALAVPQPPSTHTVMKVKMPNALAQGVAHYGGDEYILQLVLTDLVKKGVIGFVQQQVQVPNL